MNIGNYTKTLRDDLRKSLLITLTLLFVCPGVWGQETWTEVSTAEALRTIFADGGNAKLTANIGDHGLTVTCTTTPVTLDLNGHTLSENYTYSDYRGPVITINQNCTLTILDTQGGGCITGGQTNGGKGAGISNSGTLTINGGTITGNNAPIDNTVSGYGGAIYNAPNATLTINGGVITGNHAHNAGGIYNEGNMYLRGGRIYSNNNNTPNSLSSGIYNTSTATLTISGKPIVENNGYGDIFLQNGMKITIDGELTGEEGRICIMMANYSQGAFTTGLKEGNGYTNPEGFKYFKSDNTSYDPYFDDTNTNEISFQTNWVALGKRFAAGGNIKLNKNYTAASSDGCLEVPAGKEVTLDLNGKDINRHLTSATTDGCVIKNQGNLTIKDTGGAGFITGGYNDGDGGGIVNNGILNIEGCEIYNNTATGNGAGIYHNGTSLNIKGRVRIHGNTGNYIEGNVYLTSGKIITINGGLNHDTRIGVTMEDYRRANTNTGVFTSGLNTYGSISNFTSDKATQYAQYINVYSDNGEAKLQTDWSHLQDAMQVNNNTITLDKDYRYGETDAGGLSVPGSTTVALNLNGHTIDRHLSSTITDGYVIKVESGGTLTISGTGTITGGRNSGDGGGIVNNGSLTIQGGTITGNRATGHGGGIYHNGASLTLSGAPVITGNTYIVSNSANNVYLPNGKLITIGAGGLTGADRSIGISMETPETFTTGLASSTLHVKFSSDNANYDTAADNTNQARLLSAWQALIKRFNDGESTIVLDKNYTASLSDGTLDVPYGESVTLDLNGHTIDRNRSTAERDGCVIIIFGTLTITDSGIGGTGSIKGGNNDDTGTAKGGGIYNKGTLTIQGGSITGNTTSGYGGGIYNEGRLTISGGTITENTSSYFGGGIYNEGILTINGGTISYNNATNGGGGICNSGSFNTSISGGTIINNSANDGGGIYLGAGTLSISGGTISDNTATSHGGGIYYYGGTFNLSGNPTVVGNTVSGEANNIFLPTGRTITINGSLTGTNGSIGITMETLNTFTSGLTTNSSGSYEKFFSDASTTTKVLIFGDEAQLKSYWYYLQDLFINASTDADHPTTIVLESGKVYKPLSNESALFVTLGGYITLNLNGQTIDRGLGSSEAQADGCVIYNQGNLRITGSGIITGGNNNDTGTAKGGGIYNTGTLILEGASSIQNNKSTVGGGFYNAGTLYINGGTVQNNSTSLDGGGIYQASGTLYINGGTIQSNTAAIGRNGAGIFYDGGTFNLAGNPTISSNTVNSVANNVYLKGNNNITITNILSNTTAIGIVCENGYTDRAFTSGLSGRGNAEKFTSNVAGREIGVNSLGEAIIGIPYTVTFEKNYASIYVNGNKYDASTLSVVAGGHLKVQVQAPSGYIPISFKYTGDIALSANDYPKSNVEYPFNMPGHDVTITAVCKRGGYCGNPSENMKYYLDGTTLRFVSYDGSSQPMATYSSNNVPWGSYNYYTVDLSMVSEISPYAFFGSHLTSVAIPSTVTSIGTFAFGNCQSLTNITVTGGTSFAADGNVLYNYGKTNLICYPAGKTEESYELPSTVTEITSGAFAYERYLKTITVAGGTAFMEIDGVLYGQNGSGTPTSLAYYPSDKADATYRMPTTVTAIADYAFFRQQHLTKLVLLHTSVPTKGNHMLDGTSFPIMVKKNMRNTYIAGENWGSSYQNRIYELDIAQAYIYLSQITYNYNGNPQSPNVTITYAGFTLEAGVDYSLRFDNDADPNNSPDLTSVNPITVYITGIEDYAGTSYTRVYNINRSFTISVTGNYATYYATENLERPDNITVYTISTGNVDFGNQKKVTLTELSYIPEGVPVLLYHDNNSSLNGTYSLSKKTTGLGSIACDTRFRGVSVDTPYGALIPDGVLDIYVMRGNHFYKVDGTLGGYLHANRCYLARLSSDPAPAPQFIGFAGETTDIEEVRGQMEDGREVYYDLNGRRLMSKPTKKGIYIHNGKKVVIK